MPNPTKEELLKTILEASEAYSKLCHSSESGGMKERQLLPLLRDSVSLIEEMLDYGVD
jgi:hypothetical protein